MKNVFTEKNPAVFRVCGNAGFRRLLKGPARPQIKYPNAFAGITNTRKNLVVGTKLIIRNACINGLNFTVFYSIKRHHRTDAQNNKLPSSSIKEVL